jgi:hypothetical protein
LYERNAASQPPATSECEPTLEHAYAEGRADEREDMRTLLQQTRCVRDGWHTFTALTMQTELLAAIDDASEHLTHQNNTA